MKHIVKRKGHNERFDERKVYSSCYYACLSAHLHRDAAEKICEKVTKQIKNWISTKKEISSDTIFKTVGRLIRKYNKDAAFMYMTHRDIS